MAPLLVERKVRTAEQKGVLRKQEVSFKRDPVRATETSPTLVGVKRRRLLRDQDEVTRKREAILPAETGDIYLNGFVPFHGNNVQEQINHY